MEKTIFIFIFIMSFVSVFSQRVHYVMPNATGGGTSWSDPSGDIQKMIDIAGSGDQIWVATGIYRPEYVAGSPGLYDPSSKDASFVINKDVHIYGGFKGGERQLSDRDYIQNVTVLNGRRFYNHVVICIHKGGTLDGFTINGGNASDINNISFGSDIIVGKRGAGIYIFNSIVTLSNLIIEKNSADTHGAAIFADKSGYYMNDVVIRGNYAGIHAGGIFNKESQPQYFNVSVTDNVALGDGCGMYNETSDVEMVNIIIKNNQTGNYGGGMYNTRSKGTIYNALICDNMVTNSNGEGGGIYNYDYVPEFINVTVTNNKASKGNGVYNDNSYPYFFNSIIYYNDVYSHGYYDYCLVEGQRLYGNNLDGTIHNPLFVNPNANGDYHLRLSSTCVNYGDISFITGIAIDLDLNPRVYGSGPDLGPYELQKSRLDGPLTPDLKSINYERNSIDELILSAYPNPLNSGDKLKIWLGSDSKCYESQIDMYLYTLEGKIIYKKTFSNGDIESDLPVLSAGMYILKLYTTEDVYVKEIIAN